MSTMIAFAYLPYAIVGAVCAGTVAALLVHLVRFSRRAFGPPLAAIRTPQKAVLDELAREAQEMGLYD